SVLFLNLPQAVVTTYVIDEGFEIPRGLGSDGCWIILGNPARLHAPLLLEDMNRMYPGTPVFGGLAGGGWDEDSIFHFHSGEAAPCRWPRCFSVAAVAGNISSACPITMAACWPRPSAKSRWPDFLPAANSGPWPG